MLNLVGLTPQTLGFMLTDAGFVWSYDGDGDLVVKVASLPGDGPGEGAAQGEALPHFMLSYIYLMPRAEGLAYQVFPKWQVVDQLMHINPDPSDRIVSIVESVGIEVVREVNAVRLMALMPWYPSSLRELLQELFLNGVAMFGDSGRGGLGASKSYPDGINFLQISEEKAIKAMWRQIGRYAQFGY